MEGTSKESIRQMRESVDTVDQKLQASFRNIHQGNPEATLARFLKARDGNVAKANKMLLDCLTWRVQNDIDNILAKPIEPKDLYDMVRDSQLIGVSGFCRKGRPVFAIGVGLSGFEKASLDKFVQSHIQINEYRDRVILPLASKRQGRHISTCIKILDMTGLKLSALNRMKIFTVISTVDDLNYPEKTDTYYIVNAPYVFTACWTAVKPMLQERTKKKVQVLKGCGREELLKDPMPEYVVQHLTEVRGSCHSEVMDLDSIPLFARVSGSSSNISQLADPGQDCFSPRHKFHVELWNHLQGQKSLLSKVSASSQEVHVTVPEEDPEPGGSNEVGHIIEHALEQLAAEANSTDMDKLRNGLGSLKLKDAPGSKENVERTNNVTPLHRA